MLSLFIKLTLFVMLVLGAMAVSISVQQLYLSGASSDKDAKLAYLWGALALIFLGVSSGIAAIESDEITVQLPNNSIKFLPIPLLCLGLVCLYRFVVLFLYKDTDRHLKIANPITIFSNEARKSQIVDAILFCVSIIFIFAVIFHPFIDPIKAEYFSYNPNLFPELPVVKYYKFNTFTAIMASGYLFVGYAISLCHYARRFQTLKSTDDIYSPLRFFQCMVKAFYLPAIAQSIFLITYYLTYYPQADGADFTASNIPRLVLVMIGAIYIAVPAILYLYFQNKNEDKQRMSFSMGFVMLPIGIWCMTSGVIFEQIPMVYITIGLLTLGFAYLPANDLIKLKDK